MKTLYYDFGEYEISTRQLKEYYLTQFSTICKNDVGEEIDRYLLDEEIDVRYEDDFERFDDEDLMKEYFYEDAYQEYKESQVSDNERYDISQKMFI